METNELLAERIRLLEIALRGVLRKAGVLNNVTRPEGAEILMASEEYLGTEGEYYGE